MTGRQHLVLVISVLASVVATVDGFIVNVALPRISHDLPGGLVLQQWTVDSYLITLGALILVAGSLSDLFGRVRILKIGLVWFGITSLMCAIAPNEVTFIIARGLQGVGGALLVPSSLALIVSTFSGPSQGKAIGTWTAWLSIATIAGPLLGGVILVLSSWRWIFIVNTVPIVITFWLLHKLDEKEGPKTNTKVDFPGTILCVLGLGLPVYALIQEPLRGWENITVAVPLLLGVLLQFIFVRHESRTTKPMLPLNLFAIRNFSAGNIATLFMLHFQCRLS
jgi:MFS family permease